MEKRKRKLGDRRDGYWLRDLPAMHLIMPSLMPNRADNEAFVSTEIDLRPIEAYLAKKNEAELIIAKNRHGSMGKVDLGWFAQYTKFTTLDNTHEH